MLIEASNLSEAWMSALDLLIHSGGEAVNLAVSIQNPVIEDAGIRGALDRYVDGLRASKRNVERISTVANTIFPQALYLPRLGSAAQAHLYEMQSYSSRISRRKNRSGTYFDRMVAWPGEKPMNQLEAIVTRLRADRKRGNRRGNAYELGVAGAFDIRIQAPGKDNKTRGFPCLSHISLTLHEGRIHMAALYRNHDFAKRAYGNYLGLGRLLQFLATETAFDVGELLCVSSHAQTSVGGGVGFGRMVLKKLVEECRSVASVRGLGKEKRVEASEYR